MKAPWARTAVVVLILTIGGFAFWRYRAGASLVKPQYRVAEAKIASLRQTVSATGTLQAWTTVDIKSKAGGRIEKLSVDVGDRVKPNQVIARIDPTDSLLTYNESKADTDAARARELQSGASYRLQVGQSAGSIAQARAGVRSSQANLAAAQARLQSSLDLLNAQPEQTAAAIAQARANYDSTVQQRLELDSTQAQDRASTRAAYDQALANNRNAQAAFERQKSLLAKGFVSRQAVDVAEAAAGVAAAQVNTAKARLDTIEAEQKAAADAAEARVRQAKAQLDSARSQTDLATRRSAVSEARAALGQAEAQVSQAKASLQLAESGRTNNEIRAYDIESARAGSAHASAALSNAKTTLDQTIVRAPSEGVVLKKYVEQGTIITSGLSLSSTGTSIVQIGDVSKMYVNVLVDETDIASVRVGQPVNVTMDAFPESAFSGKVTLISPQAEVSQNVTSVAVRVEIDNSQAGFEKLKPSMNATCEFVVEERKGVLSIPADAVQSDANGSYVQVVPNPPAMARPQGNRKVRAASTQTISGVQPVRRAVKTGFQGDDSVEIRSGLEPGDVVVVQTVTATTTNTSSTRVRGAMGGMGGGPPPPGGR